MKAVGGLITHFEEKYDEGAPIDVVLENANKIDMNRKRVEQVIEKLKQKGKVYEPTTDHLRMAPDYDTPAEMDERDHSQREAIKSIKQLIADIEQDHDNSHAPIDVVIERADEVGIDPNKAGHEIEKLKQKGEVYNPPNDSTVECLRTT